MTNEQKKQLLLDLIKIEENDEIFNFPRAERAEFQKWVDGLIYQEPRWIPVSERLPEERIAVLVWCPERKNIYCACYEKKQWWIFGAYFEKVTLEVIAWMPLPSSYSEVEE